MKTAIIIPAFNEASSIGALISGIKRRADHEVVVVDDGSIDDTAGVSEKLGARAYRHPTNCGVGAATVTGMASPEASRSDIMITLDGDGQHDPQDIDAVAAPILKGEADVVIGSRFLTLPKGDQNNIPFIRRIYNKIANVISWSLSGIWLTDSQSGFRAYSRKALAAIRPATSGYHFITDVNREIAIRKLRVREAPIRVQYSEYSLGKGQNFSTGLEALIKLVIQSLFR